MSKTSSERLRVYKFYDAKWGLENLLKQHLKISTIKELNDPFEFNHLSIGNPDHTKLWEFLRIVTYEKYGIICFS